MRVIRSVYSISVILMLLNAGVALAHEFFGARVLEIPTPRWVVYDALRFGIEVPEGAEQIAQERAYTSPIWYSPED